MGDVTVEVNDNGDEYFHLRNASENYSFPEDKDGAQSLIKALKDLGWVDLEEVEFYDESCKF